MTGGPGERILVFVGPSLPSDRRPADPVFEWRPPAVAGDAYAIGAARPTAVVLIDGLFDDWPAIRHKELLHLIGRRIPVIGGASMGALRATELQAFGMIGVGRIFAAYASGRLVGDDEVAVLHGPADFDWGPLTEPLVNVRATLLSAARRRIVDLPSARGILRAAVALFYKERTWRTVLRAGGVQEDVDGAALAAFEQWLPGGYVDLKQIDALTCLEAALRLDRTIQPPRSPPPETLFSLTLAEQIAARLKAGQGSLAPPPGSDAEPRRIGRGDGRRSSR